MSNNCVDDLRKCFGKFATGVCILLSEKNEAYVNGLTINSFVSISLDPVLISFSLKTDSKYCMDLFQKKNISVNVLSSVQQDLARACSVSGGSFFSMDQIVEKESFYFIPKSLATFFCNIQNTFQGGDHTIYVCEVVDILKHNNNAPLVFFDSNYCSIF